MNGDRKDISDTAAAMDIRSQFFSFQGSRVLLTAFELGIFSALGSDHKTSEEIAKELATDPRATNRLMNALCALEFLNKKHDKFYNTESSRKFLVQGERHYMAGIMHGVHLWDTWSTLTDAVRQGKSVVNGKIRERGDNWLEAFIAAMDDRAKKQAPVIAEMLDFSGVSRVLDVGGGSGAFSIAFVEQGNGITATIFDLPEVLPLTQKYIAAAGMTDRIGTMPGDYNSDELGSGYDLVFLSAIVHSNSLGDNRKLVRKCASALNRNGRLVIQDFIMDDDRTSPAHGALFALNMLVGTQSGDTFTDSEVRHWMTEAGLSEIQRHETPFGVSQIIGRKL